MKDIIIEFLIANQATFKADVIEYRRLKDEYLKNLSGVFRSDIEEQYEARIKQHIAFVTGEILGLPVEYIIIELERIDVDEYLNV